jgi:hypothetical protein
MANFNIDYLVVAGGASGANQHGGGGGAGGLRTSYGSTSGGGASAEPTLSLTTGTSYSLTVGDGGAGVTWVGANLAGNNGYDSVFNNITSIGGGGGSSYATQTIPSSGGSGGGGGSQAVGAQTGASGEPGQGYAGGSGFTGGTPYPGGGGGGAGGLGGNATTGVGGNGGDGLQNDITVTTTGTGPYYAGGGGSATYGSGTPGTGGSGIGGAGKYTNSNGNPGNPQTGSGGGGTNGGFPSGSGGSGIVILRYTTADVASYTTTGLTPTEDTTTIPGQTILSFTTVGTGTITFTTPTPPTFSGTKVTTPVTDFNKTNTEEGLKIPSGTSSNQPTGVDGMVRNDTTQSSKGSASAITYYNGTNWRYFENELNSFNTVLYNGNGSSSGQAITGVGFKPDLVWVKRRNAASRHQIQHSLEAGWIDSSDTIPYAPSQAHIDNRPVSTFDSDGFTIPTNYTYNNNVSGTYVAWCWKAGGLINKAADFNGSSSYIYNAVLPLSGNTTISFWVKPEATQNQYANIIDYNHSSSGGFTIQQNSNNTNQYSFAVNNSGSFNSTGYFPLTANVWSNVVITLDSSGNANVIVNNNSVATGIGLLGLSSNALSIGRWIGGSSRYFNGLIGQVRFFNQVLASSDITALYNETAADNSVLNYPQSAGCVAAYPLGENANDLSNTYNGTASNVTFGKPGYLTRNTEGTIESTVSANVAAGFSVVEVTDHTNTQTIGHGLDSAPELIITKVLDSSSYNWYVYHKDLGNDKYLNLNTTGAANTDNFWNYTFPTSSVFTHRFSSTAFDMIYYCFHSVDGYSKIGSYVGDGGTNNFISTGFEPAFVMIKRTDSTSNWRIFDNKRGTQKELYANSTAAEPSSVSYINFNDLGFTLTSNGGWINNLNGEFIYMALATS